MTVRGDLDVLLAEWRHSGESAGTMVAAIVDFLGDADMFALMESEGVDTTEWSAGVAVLRRRLLGKLDEQNPLREQF